MSAEHKVPMSISFSPRVLRALRHYVRFRVLEGKDLPEPRFGFSTAANELLAEGLRRHGFSPEKLRLMGQGPHK